MPVGDERALRVGGERRAAEDLAVRELNDDERDRILVLERDRAVVHRDCARETALARLGHVERGPEPRDGAGIAARARGCELGPQPGDFRLRLPQGVPHASELRLESREEPLRLHPQAVRPRLEPGDFACVARALPLQQPEPGEHHDEQPDQELSPAMQLRHLGGNPQRGARAPGSRRGHRRVPLARGGYPLRGRRRRVRHSVGHRPARQDVERHRGPVLPETDHVTVRQHDVARDARAVDERAVRAAQVPHHEGLAVAHDPGVARGDVEVAVGIEADVREGVPAEADVRLAKGLHLPDACAGEERELSGHWLRLTR